MKQLLEEKEME